MKVLRFVFEKSQSASLDIFLIFKLEALTKQVQFLCVKKLLPLKSEWIKPVFNKKGPKLAITICSVKLAQIGKNQPNVNRFG